MPHADLVVGREGRVATIRICRGPHNFFDAGLIGGVADALAAVDADPEARVSLLMSEGRNFCAGADFSRTDNGDGRDLYAQAARLFGRAKPMVAAVQGAAVGGGLGLALAADFRVAAAGARFHANFAALGLHPGFAITHSLPAVVGAQVARDMLLTARAVPADEALAMGLADRIATADGLVDDALDFAGRLAANAPLSLVSIRRAVRALDQDAAVAAMAEERRCQEALIGTEDFREAARALAEARPPAFVAR